VGNVSTDDFASQKSGTLEDDDVHGYLLRMDTIDYGGKWHTACKCEEPRRVSMQIQQEMLEDPLWVQQRDTDTHQARLVGTDSTESFHYQCKRSKFDIFSSI